MKIDSVEKLQEIVGGYRAARIVQSAVSLRIFDYTRAGQPVDAACVARAAGLSLRGTDILLDALTALGLLTKNGHLYQNSDLAESTLVTGCGSMVMFSIDHAQQIYRRWAYLPESVKDGRPHRGDSPGVVENPDANRVFIRAMHARGLSRGRKIAASLDLSGIQRVADIGGGAGSYLIALAERIPGMEGFLFDLKLTLQTAEMIISEHDPDLQFHLVETDMFQDDQPFGDNFDLVILSNIIHIVGPDQNVRLLKRIRNSMKNGGQLLIQDFLLNDSATEPAAAAMFAVNMLTGTETGRAWRETDVRAWLNTAGFTRIDRLDAGTDSDILIAV